MITVKISKKGHFYLSENDIRLCEDCDYIEKINDKTFALEFIEEGKINWKFYNIDSKAIDLTLYGSRLINERLNGCIKEETLTFDQNDSFVVYKKQNLEEILKIIKNEDKYNFHYIGDGYSVYEKNIYKGPYKIGPISQFPVIYKNNYEEIIKIEDVLLYFINRENFSLKDKKFTLFKESIPDQFDKLLRINDVFIFKKGDSIEITHKENNIYEGGIDDNNEDNSFNIGEGSTIRNKKMIEFSNGSGNYIITNNDTLNGPFKIIDFENNRIFECKEYSLFYKDKTIIKYTHHDHKLIEEDSPYEFKLHLNALHDILYIHDKEYGKLCVGDDTFYYNDISKKFMQLQNSYNVTPSLLEDKIYFLDENLNERIFKIDIDPDFIISDYTYHKNNLYVIFCDDYTPPPKKKYIVYDVMNNVMLKTFDSFIMFSNHQGFFLTDTEYHAASFIYTLNENGNQIIKLPFKTRGIRVVNNSLLFQNMNRETVSLSIEEPIYIKEK